MKTSIFRKPALHQHFHSFTGWVFVAALALFARYTSPPPPLLTEMDACLDIMPIDPSVCPAECNLVNYGDFEDFTTGQNAYYTGFVAPFNSQVIVANGYTVNTVDILSDNSNQYLRMISSSGGYQENALLPLCSAIDPGCSFTVEFKACASTNPAGAQQLTVGVWALTQLPANLEMPANLPCNGTLLDNQNNVIGTCLGVVNVPVNCSSGNVTFPVNPFSLSGSYSGSVTHIWIKEIQVNQEFSTNVYLDDISVTKDCENQITVDPNVTSACPGGQVAVDFEVCNSGSQSTPATVTLTPDLSGISGVTLSAYNPEFPGGTATINNLAAGECTTVSLYLDLASSLPGGTPISFPVAIQPNGACIKSSSVQVDFTVENCDSLGCDCPAGSLVIGTPGTETLLSDLVALGLLPANPTVVTNFNLTVQGTLVMDADMISGSDNEYRFGVGSDICMLDGAEIKVPSGNTLRIHDTHIRGCLKRWKSITVETGATLIFSTDGGGLVEDAQYAVFPQSKAEVSIQRTEFNKNYISLYFNDPFGEFNLEPFFGNTMQCTAPLKPHYDPNDPNDGTWSYAGIYTIGQDILDIVSFGAYSTNYFVNLRNGIITIGAHLTVRGAQFIDILDMNEYGFLEGYGIWAQAVNGSRRLTVQGFGETGTPSFQNCTNGILSWGMAVDGIRNNNMLQMGFGVRSLFARDQLTIFDNAVEASRMGIGTVGMHPMTQMLVFSNNLDLTASGARGIQMTGGGTTPAGGFTFSANGNNLNLYEPGQQGIGVLTLNQALIRNNTVQAFGNGTSMTGLNLQGSHDNILQCNDITGLDPTSGTAVRAWDAENTAWRCNKIGNTENGVYVLMGGHSPDNFIGTSIGNHTWGLRIDGNPTNPGVLGQQHHTGNRWIGSYTGAGARHESNNQFVVSDSRFTVHTTTPPYHPPSVGVEPGVQQTDFFTFQPGTPNTFCLDFNACPVDEFSGEDPQIHDIDLDIAGGTTGSPESRYLAERYLYRKLLRNPQLVQAGSVLDSFYNQKSNEPVGMLVQMEQALAALFVPAPADSAALAANDAAIADSLAQVMLLDSLIAQSSGQDSLDLLDQRLATLQALDSLTQVQDSLLDLIQTARTVEAAQLAAQNAAIPASYLFEVNEQTVNDIFLNTIASGVYSFDSLQQTTLETIAYQCPLMGGTAVFRARGLLSLVDDYDFGDDVVNCQEVGNRSADGSSANEMEEGSLLIYPNPASTVINVILPKGSNGDYSRLQLLDVSGMVVREVQTPEQTSLRMDVSELPRGVYLCKVHQLNGPPLIAKFVLIK